VPRPAKPWKRKEDGFYYCTLNGKQEKLSANYDEALDLFHTLRANRKRAKRPAAKLSTTLKEVCDGFLELAQKTKAENTYRNQLAYLQSFCDRVGKHRRVHDIQGRELDDWVLAQGWALSTQAAARRTAMACFNWGVKNGLILESPLWGMPRGRYERRERILSAAEREKIRGVVKGNLKDFLCFLEFTGCRPFSEAATITADMIDWDQGSITFLKHKTASKGKRRVVYLPPTMLTHLKELAREHPDGPLFRTRAEKPWSRPAAAKAMRRLERKAGVSRLTPYAFRHTAITDALAKGIPAHVVAELMGTSVRIISRYYAHLDARRDVLREAARKLAEVVK
jgi:integrase